MKSMHLLLDEVEREWRDEVSLDFPLRSDTPVVRTKKSEGRDWEFSTDLKKIFATIVNGERLQKRFKELVAKYWDGNPEELARETLHYLLFHELYHPIEAPFSVSGEDNDNKKRLTEMYDVFINHLSNDLMAPKAISIINSVANNP